MGLIKPFAMGGRVELAKTNWPGVAHYLEGSTLLLIPVGSVEQHGPNGLIGTDHLVAEALARRVGEEEGILVAPTLAYGMSHHHLAFPGSTSLSPRTLILVVNDLLSNFYRNGFRRFFFVNGHGGNDSSLKAAFSEFLLDHPEGRTSLANWWLLPEVVEKEKEFFGKVNGYHATCGEVSVTWHLFPDHETPIAPGQAPDPHHEWPLGPDRFRSLYPDGRMGSDPSLSTAGKGAVLFDLATRVIREKVREFGSAP